MAPLRVLTQEALDCLDAGICVVINNTHPKYELIMLWFTEPRHLGLPPPTLNLEDW